MKIALIQSDIVWADPAGNRAKMRSAMEKHPGAELYVLPEMFTTGFNSSVEENEDTVKLMHDLAQEHDCAIAGSIAVRVGDRVMNRFYFVTPEGVEGFYDKRHLFANGGETALCTAGTERKVVTWRGIRFLMIVCFDVRFPVWVRCRDDYDAILCVASWPAKRREHWDALLKARAIENQCYVAGVNRVGTDPYCEYNGGTVLLDPWGHTLVQCADGCETVCIGEIYRDEVAECRRKFPAQEDADDFTLNAGGKQDR